VATARSGLGWLLAFLLVGAGIGWLYLVRHAASLDFGPHLSGALPLQQLAGDSSQPLGRMAVAWVPTGAAAGLVLAVLTRTRVAPRMLGLAVVSFVTLWVTTAASDAVAQNERLSAHLSTPLQRDGLWAAVLLMIIGSLLVETALPAARRAGGAAAAG
jgi:uncharacterized protein YfiM (DUF2279 family)